MNREQMSSASQVGNGRETLHEILTKVNNAKTIKESRSITTIR